MTTGLDLADRKTRRPAGIFDVRDHYLERQRADGTAATVAGPIRFAVRAVVAPGGRVEPDRWALDTRRTLSGLSVFLDRVIDRRPPAVARRLISSATSVELRVSSPGFQSADVAFAPTGGQRIQVDLAPGVTYPFDRIAGPPGRPGPSLLRGSIADEGGRGVADAVVAVPGAPYDYRTGPDGAWVIVLPEETLWPPGSPPVRNAGVTVTLDARWRRAEVVAGPWVVAGLVVSATVPVGLGVTGSAPELRLRLT